MVSTYNLVPMYDLVPTYNLVPTFDLFPTYDLVPMYNLVPTYDLVPMYRCSTRCTTVRPLSPPVDNRQITEAPIFRDCC